MQTKYEKTKEFLTHDKILICPICKNRLSLQDHSLVCLNKHTFDISKKGTVTLLKENNLKQSKIYNKTLFTNRREFIKDNFYKQMYEEISHIINKIDFKNVLDLGCGEGLHTLKILNKLNKTYKYYGLDYSKDAINMASDYNSKNRFYFISDINNIPIKDKSIDLIIDILSPYNTEEIKRLLKKDKYFIKVSPGKDYLKELRKSVNMKEYEKQTDVENNLHKNFKSIEKKEINKSYEITEEQFKKLLNMTPIQKKETMEIPKKITINLVIYIIKGE